MADVTITLKLTAREYDLLRDTIIAGRDQAKRDALDTTNDLNPRERSTLRAISVQLEDLVEKLH